MYSWIIWVLWAQWWLLYIQYTLYVYFCAFIASSQLCNYYISFSEPSYCFLVEMLHYPVQTLFNTLPTEAWGGGGGGGSLTGYRTKLLGRGGPWPWHSQNDLLWLFVVTQEQAVVLLNWLILFCSGPNLAPGKYFTRSKDLRDHLGFL